MTEESTLYPGTGEPYFNEDLFSDMMHGLLPVNSVNEDAFVMPSIPKEEGVFLDEAHLLQNGIVISECSSTHYEVPLIPSPTCKLPCLEEYPGPYNFALELNSATSGKKWLYSNTLQKLFVDVGSKIPIQFKWNQGETGLFVRGLLVYISPDSFELPVLRCPNHSSPLEESNKGFLHVKHVMRCDHQGAFYDVNEESQRLSVVVPLDMPQPGTDSVTVVYTFMCKNSCPVGMNRRSTSIIFTLETASGEVIGRRILKVRVCSCPKRDKQKEEREEDLNNVPSGKRPIDKTSSNNSKKIKLENDDDLIKILVPRNHLVSVATIAHHTITGQAYLQKRELTANEKALTDYYKQIMMNSKSK